MRKEGRDVDQYWSYSPDLRGYLRTQPDGSVTVSTRPPLEPPKQSPADEALAAMRRREARDRDRGGGFASDDPRPCLEQSGTAGSPEEEHAGWSGAATRAAQSDG